jgi:hypothetical protein
MHIHMYKHDDVRVVSYNDLIKKVPCRARRVTLSWPTGAADFRLGLRCGSSTPWWREGIALWLILPSAGEMGRCDDRKADEASFVVEKIVDDAGLSKSVELMINRLKFL